jgi:hypothetical protein
VIPVEVVKPGDTHLLEQILYSIDDLSELPVLEARLPARFPQIGFQIPSVVRGQTLALRRLDVLLGPLHIPPVERRLDTGFMDTIQILFREQPDPLVIR